MTLDAQIRVDRATFGLAVDIRADAGSVLAILGPNGAGKTTVLRALAGTGRLDRGRVALGDVVLDEPERNVWLPPERRRVSLLHQDLLLFPHLDATDNVAFGPRAAGTSRSAARAQAVAWLERFDLAHLADATPSQLSGGQAQRVALARALAADPLLLLLDEPLAALDVGTRQTTRRDLRRWLDGFGGVTVLVTHDPLDALTLADQVVVLEAGTVTQAGALLDVASRPRTPYVAALLGTNLIVGEAAGRSIQAPGARIVTADDHGTGPVFATIAPRSVTVHTSEPAGSARNRWPATVTAIDLLGDRVRVHTDGPLPLVAEVTPMSVVSLDLEVGRIVWTAVKATEVSAYPR